ncbi:MAG: serine hydrolase domain-containing protein [Chloroflexota bacterium]
MKVDQLDFSREVDPASVGMDTKAVRRVGEMFDDQFLRGLHSAGQMVVLRHGQVVLNRKNGLLRLGSYESVQDSTPFLTFSVTKPLTAVCMYQLIEMDLVSLDDPIAKYWPEFGQKGKEAATVRHALTHQAGIPARGLYPQIPRWWSWDAVVRSVAELEVEYEPGSKTAYHALNYGFILGEIVRRVTGKSIDQYMEDHVFQPLKMRNSWLGLPRSQAKRAAELYSTSSDQNGAVMLFRSARHTVLPAATLNSTAQDLAVFYQMMLNGGTMYGKRILEEETVNSMLEVQFAGHDHTFDQFVRWGGGVLLGGEKPAEYADRPPAYGRKSSPSTFGHPGQRSSTAWADSDKDVVLAYTVNTLVSDQESAERWASLADAIWDAIQD